MYSHGGGVANGGRIHNPRPDPAEVGPPRRVNREESHVGEMVASSKRRVAWTFTLGESDTVHEVVIVHSILTYKKVVEFDGRQMHFSATATPGDWSYTMFLDNTKYAIEVRINDLESADVPKYDLVIDRVPFRRWDVYRRRKQLNGASAGGAYGGHQPYQQSYQPQHASGAPASAGGGGGDSFGKHKWGPSGMTAPPPMETSPPAHAQRNSGSFFRGESSNASYQSPPPAPGQYNGAAPQRQSFQGAPAAAPSAPAPQAKKPPQKEIDLLGDFGSTDASTVTAQQLIFDPLAGTKLGAAPQQPSRTASNPMMPSAMQPQSSMRTASNPQIGYPQQQQQAQPYVDPFASVAQPVPIKPAASSFNLDPLASQGSMYMQQNRAAPVSMPSYPAYQPQQGGMPRGMPMQQQQQPMQGGFPVSSMPSVSTGYQPPKVGGGAGGANYNISHLMNPMEVNSVRNAQQTKTINIDPFAGMHK